MPHRMSVDAVASSASNANAVQTIVKTAKMLKMLTPTKTITMRRYGASKLFSISFRAADMYLAATRLMLPDMVRGDSCGMASLQVQCSGSAMQRVRGISYLVNTGNSYTNHSYTNLAAF